MYKFVVEGQAGDLVNAAQTMLFKENEYQLGSVIGDTLCIQPLPPQHSLVLLIIAVPSKIKVSEMV